MSYVNKNSTEQSPEQIKSNHIDNSPYSQIYVIQQICEEFNKEQLPELVKGNDIYTTRMSDLKNPDGSKLLLNFENLVGKSPEGFHKLTPEKHLCTSGAMGDIYYKSDKDAKAHIYIEHSEPFIMYITLYNLYEKFNTEIIEDNLEPFDISVLLQRVAINTRGFFVPLETSAGQKIQEIFLSTRRVSFPTEWGDGTFRQSDIYNSKIFVRIENGNVMEVYLISSIKDKDSQISPCELFNQSGNFINISPEIMNKLE
jgi:hypothetical protein